MSDRFTERRLEASERPRRLYEYHVTGTGHFPYDMLRYDECWPASGDAVGKMDQDVTLGDRSARSVKLRSYHPPTVDRWLSFTWSVGALEIA